MIKIINKEFYRNKVHTLKALKGYSFSGYWDNLYHYSKRVDIYGGKYKPLRIVLGGIIFRDIVDNKEIKLSNKEISKLQKSYKYQCVSLDKEELENNNLMLY